MTTHKLPPMRVSNGGAWVDLRLETESAADLGAFAGHR